MRANAILIFAPFALLGCGQGLPSTATTEELPLSSELAIVTGEGEQPESATTQALSPDGAPNLFRLAREGLAHFHGDVRALLGRIHDVAASRPPTMEKDGVRIWVHKEEGLVMRLAIEKKRLGDIHYGPEDELPGDGAVDDGQGAPDRALMASRFRLEIRKATEDDGAFRLAAHGHVVRIKGEPLGTGALVIRRARIAEVDGRLVAGRDTLAARFDHRGKVRRIAVGHKAASNQGDAVRAVWVYRRFDDQAGVLKLVRWGDLPGTPVEGGKNELVTMFQQWLRTPDGLVARAHARVTGGDLGGDALNIVECMNGIDKIGFRLVVLHDGSTWKVGSHGDPKACRPFERDVPPPPHDGERLPDEMR